MTPHRGKPASESQPATFGLSFSVFNQGLSELRGRSRSADPGGAPAALSHLPFSSQLCKC